MTFVFFAAIIGKFFNLISMPYSNKSLKEMVPLTLRRGIPYSEGQDPANQQLAILNFSDTGPYHVDGVLPVFIAPVSSSDQLAMSRQFDFDLDARQDLGEEGVIDGGADALRSITWGRFLSVNPEIPEDYSDDGDPQDLEVQPGMPLAFFVNESLNIYKSLLGFQFEINNPANIESDKTLVVFSTGPISSGADTETREAFVKEWGDYEVAGFTTVSMPHFSNSLWSNFYDVKEREYKERGPLGETSFSLDDTLPSWKRLITITFKSTVHEQGHTLGLTHPGFYNGAIKSDDEFIWTEDSMDQSIMSYSLQPKTYELFGNTQGFPLLDLTPRVLDLLALDEIYSKQEDSKGNTFGTHRAFLGDTVYGFNTNITEDQSIVYANLDKLYDYRIATTIADGEGNDTIDASEFKYGNTIDLYVMTGNETTSRLSSLNGTIGNLSLAVGTVIENAIGGDKDDKILDNQYDNRLVGNAGDDWFSASGGIDRIIGGSGYDRAVIVGNEDDFIINNKSKSKTVIRHKTSRNFRVTLKDVEKYIFGDPMETALNTENRGGQMVSGSQSDLRSNALLGMPYEEPTLNFLGASDQLL